jgi:hypothetical protein
MTTDEYFELKSQGMFKETDFVPVSWVKGLLKEWENLCKEELFQKVRRMRTLQMMYFSNRELKVLREAKKAEADVDLAVNKFFSPMCNPERKPGEDLKLF